MISLFEVLELAAQLLAMLLIWGIVVSQVGLLIAAACRWMIRQTLLDRERTTLVLLSGAVLIVLVNLVLLVLTPPDFRTINIVLLSLALCMIGARIEVEKDFAVQ